MMALLVSWHGHRKRLHMRFRVWDSALNSTLQSLGAMLPESSIKGVSGGNSKVHSQSYEAFT